MPNRVEVASGNAECLRLSTIGGMRRGRPDRDRGKGSKATANRQGKGQRNKAKFAPIGLWK
jgi:hypothetical protein